MHACGAECGRTTTRTAAALAAALLLSGVPASGAEASRSAEEASRERETGWRFGLVLDAAAVRHRVGTRAAALAPPPPTPLDADAEGMALDGASGSAAARVWLPVRVGPLRPWLQAGYREPVGDLEKTGAEVVLSGGLFGGLPVADLRAEYTGGPHAAVGVDVELEPFGHALALAPYVGWERAGYEARLQAFTVAASLGLADAPGTSRELTVDGLLTGLEARTPIWQAESLRLELLLGVEHLEPVDGEATLDFVNVVPVASGAMEVEDVWRGRAGLVVSF